MVAAQGSPLGLYLTPFATQPLFCGILRPRFELFQPLDKSVGQRFIEAIQSPYLISQCGAHAREIGTSFEVVIPVHQDNYPLSSDCRPQLNRPNVNFVNKYNPNPQSYAWGLGPRGTLM